MENKKMDSTSEALWRACDTFRGGKIDNQYILAIY